MTNAERDITLGLAVRTPVRLISYIKSKSTSSTLVWALVKAVKSVNVPMHAARCARRCFRFPSEAETGSLS